MLTFSVIVSEDFMVASGKKVFMGYHNEEISLNYKKKNNFSNFNKVKDSLRVAIFFIW